MDSTRTIRRTQGRPHGGVTAQVIEIRGRRIARSGIVSGARVVVGRAKSADLVVDDPTVSEFHAELRPHRDGILVEDLGSHNGTFFGEVRVSAAIFAGIAELQLGQSLVRVACTREVPDAAAQRESFGLLRGASSQSRALFGELARVAPTDLSVLLDGPTGTGKELAAHGIHDQSSRGGKCFQVLDCTAIPPRLAESVLFGHERGAFTGAETARPGIFEAAEGGTVFMDEIGDLPLELQPKLLRVLEARQITRVGGRDTIPVDVRLISASWRNLRQMVNEGRFRDDLYHRLAQVRIVLPALDARREDIPDLVLHFLRSLPTSVKGARTISREAMASLQARAYPGNVRELRNVVERAAQMAEGAIIVPSDLAFDRILERGRGASLDRDEGGAPLEFKTAKQTAIDDFERAYLQRLCEQAEGSLRRAATIAGVQRHYLRAIFRKHGIAVSGKAD